MIDPFIFINAKTLDDYHLQQKKRSVDHDEDADVNVDAAWDDFNAESCQRVFFMLQPMFTSQSLSPSVNRNVLLQGLISEGFVFEYMSPIIQHKWHIVTFTDRTLNDIPKTVAHVIQGPFEKLLRELENYKSIVHDVAAESLVADENTTETCTSRIFLKIIPNAHDMWTLKDYFFIVNQDMQTSLILSPPQIEINMAINKFTDARI